MLIALLLGGEAMGGPIYLDDVGREWLDLNSTRFRSWNDTALVCDAVGGDCSGVLTSHTGASSDIDISGYRWATRDEVRELFYEIGDLPVDSLNSYSASFSIGEGHGSRAFSAFDPTIQFSVGPGIENILHGITRDTYLDSASMLRSYNGVIENPPFGSDSFTLTGGLGVDTREISAGVFLYRAAVPEPGTLALFGVGLAGLFLALRRAPARTLLRRTG